MATVLATCSKCKQQFEMDEELYRHRKAHGSKINCPACLEKSHINKYKKASETHKKNWAAYDPEARAERVKNAKEGIHNMSDEKKALRSLHSSIATKNYMASLSEEEKRRRSEMTSLQMMERNAKMTHEEYVAYATKVRNTMMSNRIYEIVLSKAERSFCEKLSQNYIRYECCSANATIDPNFFELFPNNPVTGGRFVNPYHMWDFKLFTPAGNIFVDVDGSVHWYTNERLVHPQSGKEYNQLDNIKFKESQRKYQCDDLPAYAIQMPTDEITDDTEVLNIRTGERIKFSDFFEKIKLMNHISEDCQKIGAKM